MFRLWLLAAKQLSMPMYANVCQCPAIKTGRGFNTFSSHALDVLLAPLPFEQCSKPCVNPYTGFNRSARNPAEPSYFSIAPLAPLWTQAPRALPRPPSGGSQNVVYQIQWNHGIKYLNKKLTMLNWDLQWSILGNSMVYRYLDLFGMIFTDPNGLVSGMVLKLWQLV